MNKKFYNAESLGRSLVLLERRYRMSSAEVFERSAAGERIDGVPNFVRSFWVSIYTDRCRANDDFTSSVKRTLETV